MFNLDELTPNQRDLVETSLDLCDFPWERLKNGLQLAVPWRPTIKVLVSDLSRFSGVEPGYHEHDHRNGVDVLIVNRQALGLAWRDGVIEVDESLEDDPALFATVFLAEAAHMVDFFYLDDDDRATITGLYHDDPDEHEWLSGPYLEQVGEAFMLGFIEAFTDMTPAIDIPFVHETTPEIGAEIRDYILALDAERSWPRNVALMALGLAALAAVARGCGLV